MTRRRHPRSLGRDDSSWGSRPRLNICRRSAARPHDSTAVDFVVRTSRPHDSTAVDFVVRTSRPHDSTAVEFEVRASRLHDSTAVDFVVRASRLHDPTAVDFAVRASRPHDSTAVNEVRPGRPHRNTDSRFLVALTEWSLARSHRPLCRWRSMKSWSHFADHHQDI